MSNAKLRFWLDNSGLHSAGRALERRAKGPTDVDSLLQLGTLALFADDITLSDFEHPDVRGRSLGLTPTAGTYN